MIEDWEIWGCALEIVKKHGDGAKAHALSRVGDLSQRGDEAGARTWTLIADRIDQLDGDDKPRQ